MIGGFYPGTTLSERVARNPWFINRTDFLACQMGIASVQLRRTSARSLIT